LEFVFAFIADVFLFGYIFYATDVVGALVVVIALIIPFVLRYTGVIQHQ
jgi:hypothetical protein